MRATVLKPIKVKTTGETFLPGAVVDREPEKIQAWAERGLVSVQSPPPEKETEIPPKEDPPDPVSLAERIGIKFEQEIPEKDLGKPVFTYRGHVLAWEADPPHIKVYAWATVNLFPGRPLVIDTDPVGRLLGLTPAQVREAVIRLVREGDLVRAREWGRETYRLNVRYAEGGTS